MAPSPAPLAPADVHVHVNVCNVATLTERLAGTYVGQGEFFSGLRTGDRVEVTRTTYAHPHGVWSEHYTARLAGGASLAIHDPADLALTASA